MISGDAVVTTSDFRNVSSCPSLILRLEIVPYVVRPPESVVNARYAVLPSQISVKSVFSNVRVKTTSAPSCSCVSVNVTVFDVVSLASTKSNTRVWATSGVTVVSAVLKKIIGSVVAVSVQRPFRPIL